MNIIFSGTVVHGKKRGKPLGFPTANMQLSSSIPHGIYISETKIGTDIYHSVTFIGNARTFGEEEVIAETYLLDVDQDLYGKTLSVTLLEKIRDNQKFENVEALTAQIQQDVKAAREFFQKRSE